MPTKTRNWEKITYLRYLNKADKAKIKKISFPQKGFFK